MVEASEGPPVPAPCESVQWNLSQGKIRSRHHERLAVVYVRQSTPQQVIDHRESTLLQYGLRERAEQLGWPTDRILVIDDDLGKSGASAEERVGFQKLVSEVSLDHVGIVLGIEMSRLARSCKDWHQLLEICALFETLIADMDGIYDPMHYNDRLLLGLKGTMSEAELHILKQRMHQGRINKARRGELNVRLPAGYLRRPSGEVVLDPDEQVQGVIRLIFRKFQEIGTLNGLLQYLVRNDIRIGGRVHEGHQKGELQWRQPNRSTLHDMLKNPIYAGAYTYGRRQADPRRRRAGQRQSPRSPMPQDEWITLISDRHPAYIPWEQYEENLKRLQANRSRAEEICAARWGPTLLSGLLVCGKCGRRMSVRYANKRPCRHYYVCSAGCVQYGKKVCQTLAGLYVDEVMTGQVLRAIEPAALELSLAAAGNLERERTELLELWQQRLERAVYSSEKAARHYHLVDPENRLVARELEREWERKLAEQRKLEEEFRRFQRSQPRGLTETERHEIKRLAADIPALWSAPSTTNTERKEIIRQVIQRVVVDTHDNSEKVKLRIEWVGGSVNECHIVRSVRRLEQLSYFDALCNRVRSLLERGLSPQEIADRLNAEGFRPPNPRRTFRSAGVKNLLRRMRLGKRPYRPRPRAGLNSNEWTVSQLAQEVGMANSTLRNWIQRNRVKARRTQPTRNSYWIVWADEREIGRLRKLGSRSPSERSRQRWIEAPKKQKE